MNRFDAWIFDSYRVSREGLGCYRIVFALFGLLVIAPGHWELTAFAGVSRFPDSFFLPPPGLMQLAPSLPPEWFMKLVVGAIDVVLVALLLGYKTRLASIGTSVLFLVGFGFSFSFGKINHVMLFVLVPLVMSASNWGAAYALDERQDGFGDDGAVYAWPITLLALLLGFGMFTSGFAKLIGGWLDPSTHATQGHFIRQYFTNGRQDFLASFFTTVHSGTFWEVLDYATVLFEVGFLFAILSPRTTRIFASIAVGFHLCTMLMLNIAFVPNLIVYAAFLDWSVLRIRFSWPATLRRPLPGGALVLGLALLFYHWGSPLRMLDDRANFTSDVTVTEVIALACAVFVVLLAGARSLRFDRAHTSNT